MILILKCRNWSEKKKSSNRELFSSRPPAIIGIRDDRTHLAKDTPRIRTQPTKIRSQLDRPCTKIASRPSSQTLTQMILIHNKKHKVKKRAVIGQKLLRCSPTSMTIQDRCPSFPVSLQRFQPIVAQADGNRLTVYRLNRHQLPSKHIRSLGEKLRFWPLRVRLDRT